MIEQLLVNLKFPNNMKEKLIELIGTRLPDGYENNKPYWYLSNGEKTFDRSKFLSDERSYWKKINGIKTV